MLKCIIELIKLEKDWVPDSNNCPGSSLYIRPTMIGTNVIPVTDIAMNVDDFDLSSLGVFGYTQGY